MKKSYVVALVVTLVVVVAAIAMKGQAAAALKRWLPAIHGQR